MKIINIMKSQVIKFKMIAKVFFKIYQLISYFKKVEIDIEQHVLTQTKKLSDNKIEKIFSRNARNESGMFTYNCHLCSVASLPGERALQMHITGKKHQQRLLYNYVPDAVQFRTPLVPKPKSKC